MKKIISAFLAVIMLFSMTSAAGIGYAADKKNIADSLAQVQTKSGYIPNQTAAVTGNCYGFISAVCEQLYGVKYQEGLNGDGYTCQHKTGYFYTVNTYTSTSSDTALCVEDIISFFVNNAYPGDIVHYASASGSSHTFMIQSIDSEKMLIYHSNYQTKSLPSSACHVDPIYWNSFRSNPKTAIYNSDGSLYSHNSLFYNKQKNGGIGITINRYTNYEALFNVSAATLKISANSTSPTSINLSWTALGGASKYQVQYKKNADADYTTLTASLEGTSFEVTNLTVGTNYNFRVCAYLGNKWSDYSNVITKKALPPVITTAVFIPQNEGLKIEWEGREDITGVKIYKSDSSKGTYTQIGAVDSTVNSFVDSDVKTGVTYYYKLARYVSVKSKNYGLKSKAFSGAYKIEPPTGFYASRTTPTSIKLNWNNDGNAIKYSLQYKAQGGKWKTINGITKHSRVFKGLTIGKIYYFRIKSINKKGTSSYSPEVKMKALPPAPPAPAVKAVNSGIRVLYKPKSYASGYYIYRSYSPSGKYRLVGKVVGKKTKSYTDKTAEKGSTYYYKIVCYTVKGGKTYKSVKSTYSSIKY